MAKHDAELIVKRMTRKSRPRGGKTRLQGCRRRSARTVRCKLVIALRDGRVCRNVKVTVKALRHSRRLKRRYHRRWVHCSRARDSASKHAAQAPASHGRLYAADSPWNQRVASDAAADAASPLMVGQLVSEVADKGWPIATGAWTNTIFYADASTPKRDVQLTSSWYAGRRLERVPVPDSAVVPGDSDGGLVVIDRSTNCEYDLARASKSGSEWSAHFANALPTDGAGVFPTADAPSASAFASAGGMILPEELASGHIDHALAFTMNNTKSGGPVAPAVGSDGHSVAPGAIPEGAHLQLDPGLDLNRLGLQPWEKTIATALQDYGMYLVDTGGAVALRVQHSASTSYRYPWDGDYGSMPSALAAHLRVLQLGAQQEPKYGFLGNRCATLN